MNCGQVVPKVAEANETCLFLENALELCLKTVTVRFRLLVEPCNDFLIDMWNNYLCHRSTLRQMIASKRYFTKRDVRALHRAEANSLLAGIFAVVIGAEELLFFLDDSALEASDDIDCGDYYKP